MGRGFFAAIGIKLFAMLAQFAFGLGFELVFFLRFFASSFWRFSYP